MPITVLKKRADFLRVEQNPKKFIGKTIILLAAPNNLSVSRVGFTISKKTSRLAVERNKIRRRLKSIMAVALKDFGQKGFDYVVIAKREALTRKFAEIKNDIDQALKKIS